MNQPLIIAELSANHLGDIERALKIIDAAAKAGADMVKFQTWEQDTMVLDRSFTLKSGPWKGKRLYDLYADAWTPWRWHDALYAAVRSHKMVPFSSVFDKASIDYVKRFDCPIFKISSFELEDLELVAYAAKQGKPMILSTGMATFSRIQQAVLTCLTHGCKDLTVLKCTSAYPASPESANLEAMKMFQFMPYGRESGVKYGVSDHTMDNTIPIMATTLGAVMIEKHLTLSRADGGPDAGFSLEPDEFAEMVKAVRLAHAALGQNQLIPAREEADSVIVKRSLYWNRNVMRGTRVSSLDCISTARPGLGLNPTRKPELLNKFLQVDVKAGQPVKLEQFL